MTDDETTETENTEDEITCWEDSGDWSCMEAMRLSRLLPRLEAVRLAIRERLAFCGCNTESVDEPIGCLSSIFDTVQNLTNAYNSIPISKFAILNQDGHVNLTYSDPGHNFTIMEFSPEHGVHSFDDDNNCISWTDGTLSVQISHMQFSSRTFLSRVYFSRTNIARLVMPNKFTHISNWLWNVYSNLNRLILPYREFQFELNFSERTGGEIQRWIRRTKTTTHGLYVYSTEDSFIPVMCTPEELDAITTQQLWQLSVPTRARSYTNFGFGDASVALRQRDESGSSETVQNIRIATDYKISFTNKLYNNDMRRVSLPSFQQLPLVLEVTRKYEKADDCATFLFENHAENSEETILPETELYAGDVKTFINLPATCPAPDSQISRGWKASTHYLTLKYSFPQSILSPFAFR